MPLYEYTCSECGKTFETLARVGEEAECPGCGSTDTTRKLGRFSVGSGETSGGGCPTGSCSL